MYPRLPASQCYTPQAEGGKGGSEVRVSVVHGLSRMYPDPRASTTPGRSTPGFHRDQADIPRASGARNVVMLISTTSSYICLWLRPI